MNESSNNPVGDRSGIGETITTALCQPPFFWAWLLGGAGTLLALPITLFLAVCSAPSPRRGGWRVS